MGDTVAAHTRALLTQALDHVAAGLEPIVARRFAELVPGLSDWTAVLREQDERLGKFFPSYNSSDLVLLLRVFTERFGALGYPFHGHADRSVSNLASELRVVRNRWAHSAPFSQAETYRALDTAELLLRGLGIDEHADRVGALKTAVLIAMQPVSASPTSFMPDTSTSVPFPNGSVPAAAIADTAEEIPVEFPSESTPESAHAEHTTEAPPNIESREHAHCGSLEFDLTAVDALSYALAHNRVAIIDEVTVRYRGPELRGASLSIEAFSPLGPLNDPKKVFIDLDGENATTIRELMFTLDPARMLSIDSQHTGTLRLTLRGPDDRVVGEHQHPVQVLAAHHWIAQPLQLGLELIASFVQPNAAEIALLAGETADYLAEATGSTSLDGYQSGSPERVDAMVKAAYGALQAREIRYAEPPASWGLAGQKVRTPNEVLAGRLGTCLDTTVTLAALLEEIGINSTLWFVPGHVFLGYWRQESSLDTVAELDVSEAINVVGLDGIRLVETTSIPQGESFETAVRRPVTEHLSLGSGHFDGITDVRQARQSGILPLPSRTVSAGGEVIVREYRLASAAPLLDHIPSDSQVVAGGTRYFPSRITQWKNKLLDLSLRNPLINYSGRSGYSLAVPQPTLGNFEDLISSGTAVTLIASDQIAQIDRSRGIHAGRDLPETTRAALLTERKQAYIALTEERYASRLRALAHKARTITEETGANNLYLALGMLSWNNGDRDLRSPLILIPVNFESAAQGQHYRIRIDEAGESTPNYSLLEKLRVTLGLEIPGLANPVRDDSGINLVAALAATRRALADAKLPFTVEDTAELATLQFAKYRLWKDIDEHWEELSKNPVVRHLVHTPTEAFHDTIGEADRTNLDAVVAALPVPADSSQAEAVIDAAHGRTFVLEGPPGTGKSQTITNLLAHAIEQGKRVLFVAEKRAALDVVKQRLDSVGLGDLSLDLHDKGARPAVFREQLTTAIDAAFQADENALRTNQESHVSSAGALRRYAERLHEPNALGLSYYGARDLLLANENGAPTLSIPLSFVRAEAGKSAEPVRETLRALPETADYARPAELHPWGFAEGTGTGTAQEIHAAARAFDLSLGQLITAGYDAKTLNWVTEPGQLDQWATLSQAPRYPLAAIDAMRTFVDSGELAQLRAQVAKLGAHLPDWAHAVGVECLGGDTHGWHIRAREADTSGFLGRKKRQRQVLMELAPMLLVEPNTIAPEQVSVITEGIQETATQIKAVLGQGAKLPLPLLPAAWNPFQGPGAAPILAGIDWVSWLVATLDPGLARGTVAEGESSAIGQLRELYAGLRLNPQHGPLLTGFAQAWRHLESTAVAQAAEAGALAGWGRKAGVINTWIDTRKDRHLDVDTPVSLQRWLDFLLHLEPLFRAGLDEAYTALRTGVIPAESASLAFDKGLAEASLVERRDTQGLALFDAESHNRAISRFSSSTERIRRELPRWIPQQVIAQRGIDPQFAGGAMGELRRQLTRKRGGMSIRGLFEEYGSIILQITPCALMSPESVSRFLPAQAELFDIVVFDEASQIRVADAVGAMGRTRSVVVVGDSRQMPPTSFAEAQTDDVADLAEASDAVADEESILSECVQARVPQRWLTWHYRSQDESLISFSNHTYYDSRLSSFPAPVLASASRDSGVSLVRVDGHFNRTEKGKHLRTNVREAEVIVAEVNRRFADSPHETPSLGIVTFNAQQRSLIEGMLREHENDRLGLALDERDGLFVKNLENVQGDERDTILFSVAFSANQRGVVPLNFGPLTRAGGERRLNVAITRARRQVVLYASFDPSDLRTENTVSVGVKHLKAYLELAAGSVSTQVPDRAVQPIADRHRDEIAAELRMRGFAVQTDVGLSDFRVDLSVASADHPEQPVLAVLLDGEAWRRRRTVADRDGLPTEVLSNLMRWPAVERVWLPEWLQNRETTLDRLSAAMESGVAHLSAIPDNVVKQDTFRVADANAVRPVPVPVTEPVRAGESVRDAELALLRGSTGGNPVLTPESKLTGNVPPVPSAEHSPSGTLSGEPVGITHERIRPFTPWSTDEVHGIWVLDELPRSDAARRVQGMIQNIVATEGPIHRQRLGKLVGESHGLSRVAQSRVDRILACVPVSFPLTEEGLFVWPAEENPGGYRFARRPVMGERRDLEQIPLVEIANAMGIIAEISGGVSSDSLRRETLQLFGGKRLTTGISARLDEAIWAALDMGRLEQHGDTWLKGSSQ